MYRCILINNVQFAISVQFTDTEYELAHETSLVLGESCTDIEILYRGHKPKSSSEITVSLILWVPDPTLVRFFNHDALM